jgi:hypothetical protein
MAVKNIAHIECNWRIFGFRYLMNSELLEYYESSIGSTSVDSRLGPLMYSTLGKTSRSFWVPRLSRPAGHSLSCRQHGLYGLALVTWKAQGPSYGSVPVATTSESTRLVASVSLLALALFSSARRI